MIWKENQHIETWDDAHGMSNMIENIKIDDIDLLTQAFTAYSIFKISWHFNKGSSNIKWKWMNRNSHDWTDFHWIDQSRYCRSGNCVKRSTIDRHFSLSLFFVFCFGIPFFSRVGSFSIRLIWFIYKVHISKWT